MPTSRAGNDPGFSLIELLVVLSILAAAAVVVPVAFSGALDKVRFESTARELAVALRQTRSLAIVQQRPRALVIDLENHVFGHSGSPPAELPERYGYELETAASERLAERVAAIRFFPDGASTGGRVLLRYGGRERAVDVDWLTGKVELNN